jgi:hypothetical protein
VSSPSKTINIKQYLSTSYFLVDNRYVVIKSSQTTQLYITKVFVKQFSCHDYIRKIIWSNSIRTFLIHQDLLRNMIISFALTT